MQTIKVIGELILQVCSYKKEEIFFSYKFDLALVKVINRIHVASRNMFKVRCSKH